MIPVPFRKPVFWAHLAAGLIIGIFVLSMSVTGLVISFEPQLIEWSERHVRTVAAPGAGTPRAGLDAIVAGVRAGFPGSSPTDVKVFSDPCRFRRYRPGQGKGHRVRGPLSERSSARIPASTPSCTRWRNGTGGWAPGRSSSPLSTLSALRSFFMILSGLYLWFPRRWTRAAVKAVSVPDRNSKARPGTGTGTMPSACGPPRLLLVTVLTGAMIGYRWAGDLLFVLTGNTPPPRPAEGKAKAGGAGEKGQSRRESQNKRGRNGP